jgi:uncharacterized protein YbaR (Trm112 family)
MRRELMEVLACPGCKEGLELRVEDEDAATGEVLSGTLTCATCGGIYRIDGGIPDLRPLNVD